MELFGLGLKSRKKETKRHDGGLFRNYGVREDMNKKGLVKSKKPQMKVGKHKAKLQMEDTYSIDAPFFGDKKRALFCVFDGHVDKNAAECVKKIFAKEMEKHLRQANADCRDMSEILRAVFLSVDQQLREFEDEGATATAAFLWQVGDDRYLQVANVGDSTAFLNRNGVAVWMSEDHKVTNPKEQVRMRNSGHRITEGQTRINGLAVSRALGDHFVKINNMGLIGEPYISGAIRLESNDSFLIVATDGLWDAMSGQEAIDLMRESENGGDMAKKLVNGALHSTKCTDNVTVIVVNL